jgi:hypothetical protein
MCRCIPLIRYPSEQVSIKSLLSVIMASLSVMHSFAGGVCATSSCLIFAVVIKMVV